MNPGCEIACPYCGEPTWVPVDADGGRRQRYVADCEVCCRPIHLTADRTGGGGAFDVVATTEDDAG